MCIGVFETLTGHWGSLVRITNAFLLPSFSQNHGAKFTLLTSIYQTLLSVMYDPGGGISAHRIAFKTRQVKTFKDSTLFKFSKIKKKQGTDGKIHSGLVLPKLSLTNQVKEREVKMMFQSI